MAKETFLGSILRRIRAASKTKFNTRKQARKFSQTIDDNSQFTKSSLNLSTEKNVNERSMRSLSIRLKTRSGFPGSEIWTALPWVIRVRLCFFRTMSEAGAWIILSQEKFHSLGIIFSNTPDVKNKTCVFSKFAWLEHRCFFEVHRIRWKLIQGNVFVEIHV